MLNNAASGTVGTLANDIRSINNKFNELTGTLFSAISSLSGGSGDIIVDASDVDIDSVTFLPQQRRGVRRCEYRRHHRLHDH